MNREKKTPTMQADEMHSRTFGVALDNSLVGQLIGGPVPTVLEDGGLALLGAHTGSVDTSLPDLTVPAPVLIGETD